MSQLLRGPDRTLTALGNWVAAGSPDDLVSATGGTLTVDWAFAADPSRQTTYYGNPATFGDPHGTIGAVVFFHPTTCYAPVRPNTAFTASMTVQSTTAAWSIDPSFLGWHVGWHGRLILNFFDRHGFLLPGQPMTGPFQPFSGTTSGAISYTVTTPADAHYWSVQLDVQADDGSAVTFGTPPPLPVVVGGGGLGFPPLHIHVTDPSVIGTPAVLLPLRQSRRDDYLGHAPRQGHANPSTSVQASARQGWRNAYR